jgi:uncharacterized protein with ParB-like and HNH nuclease domain/predicted transport protein
MQANTVNLLQFISGNNKQFVIPIYQRTYSWTTEQCKQLWDDIIRTALNPNIPGHFVGSIVYIHQSLYIANIVQELLVIDGQQRLTTLSLLLIALGKAKEGKANSSGLSFNRIRNSYLVNSDESGDLFFRLLLTQTDRSTLQAIINESPLPEKTSYRIVRNLDFFEKLIQESKIELDKIFEGLGKLIIVQISLDRTQDNPQLIFESMNSTGLELSQADLIRNFILMGLEPEKQTELYQNYWYRIEESFGHGENTVYFDRFMRDYLTIQNQGNIPNIDKVYAEFKIFIRNKLEINMKNVVAEIYRYSKFFAKLAFGKEQDKDIYKALGDINTLKVDVAYPFLMEVLSDYEKELITKEVLIKILRLVESYVFRRVICGIPTNSLNKTFANIYREIDKSAYLQSVQAAFLLKTSYQRLPNDEEFFQQFIVKDVYNFRNRNYLLRKLENFDRSKEMVVVEDYTIEHIMPQNEDLSEAWKRDLGPNWNQVHERYLHTIGNLTLTGYNSEYSDHSFLEKRDYPENKGFRNSPIILNQYLANLDRWNEDTIKERAEILATKALSIWAIPDVPVDVLIIYNPKISSEDIQEYSLDHYEFLRDVMLDLFFAFRQRVLNIDSSVHQENKKLYIAFKSVTNFVDVVPRKSKLHLSLNIPFNEISDPNNICRDVSNIGRWGNGDTSVNITSENQLDEIMNLVEQAFNWQAEH